MESSQRLFIGLDLPPATKTLLFELNPRLGKLRWLPPEQLHLTLSFLGEVVESAQTRLEEVLREVQVGRFFLPLEGMGIFLARGRPSVVWVGTGRGHPHLFALHKHIQDAVLRAGLEPDLRPFHPHVTVGRGQGISKEALQPFLKEHRESEFGLVPVEGFTLFASHLEPEGARYEEVLRVGLG